MTQPNRSDSHRPAGILSPLAWVLTFLAYMMGYEAGRTSGQFEGYARATRAWSASLKESIR